MSEKVEWQKPTEEQWLLIAHLIISKLKSTLFKNLLFNLVSLLSLVSVPNTSSGRHFLTNINSNFPSIGSCLAICDDLVMLKWMTQNWTLAIYHYQFFNTDLIPCFHQKKSLSHYINPTYFCFLLYLNQSFREVFAKCSFNSKVLAHPYPSHSPPHRVEMKVL